VTAAPTFYEFFAGGGMARLGLGSGWTCLRAIDFDPKKVSAYRANFGEADVVEGDVWNLSPADLPDRADLAWASSPCQDLSLAGARAGLSGGRSSAFWGFWRLIERLDDEGRAPKTLVVENVVGLLTSRGGADLVGLCRAFAGRGYRFGALELDAAWWLPQSRPRVFVIATRRDPAGLVAAEPEPPFHTRAVEAACARLPETIRADWSWWRLAAPPPRNQDFAAVLEPDDAIDWLPDDRTERLLGFAGGPSLLRLQAARASRERRVGAAYRRVRVEAGVRVQRLEVRFDGLAGCLRTPAGGSSRQFVIVAEDGRVRVRLLTAREAARLMGLPDDYRLPSPQTAALKLCGDGVAVPVVRALADGLLEALVGVAGPVRRAALSR
jgi:DNA (cytosine-5)-methyltransferase 1